ncbi:glycerol-3-phosphate dehydrogenase/oxidase [Actinomycetes bacterium KLBMP 9759]
MTGASLNAARRAEELDALAGRHEPVDLLVIGGGVTGAGVALDAATRGLTVVLAEKHDLAFGTSRWSSKLVHGGLRYLAGGHVGIAHESAVERGILLRHTAPHLVRALPQLLPLLPATNASVAGVVRAGQLAGDVLRVAARTPGHMLPRSRRVSRTEVRHLAPTVRTEGLRGGLLFWDGQLVDDARLVVGLARTAASHGAVVLTHCEATQVTGHGAVLEDGPTGAELPVAARMVVNATGVWAGGLVEGIRLRPSRGTHLVLPQAVFAGGGQGLQAGLTVPVPGSIGRFVFALPALDGRVYVGLTDEDAPGPVPDVPTASDAEIDFLLSTIGSVLRAPLTRSDLLGTYSGLRPLLDAGGGASADVSRKHVVVIGADGLVTVVGGKLTTYRRMAQDALDAALRQARIVAGPCRTARLPLVGAVGTADPAPDRLVRLYGTEAAAVAAEAGGDPALLEPIAQGVPTTMAELLFAVRHEGALDESDLLDRRTRIGLDPAARERALPAAQAALAHATG